MLVELLESKYCKEERGKKEVNFLKTKIVVVNWWPKQFCKFQSSNQGSTLFTLHPIAGEVVPLVAGGSTRSSEKIIDVKSC